MSAILVETVVNSNIEKVWRHWVDARCIVNWNHASEDWHCPKAVNDLAVGGKFSFIMASRDGRISFDFNGVYTEIELQKLIKYVIEGGRKVAIEFIKIDDQSTKVRETFDAENENDEELQRNGWAAILSNFKKHCESETD